jgi:putative FmdB family regulatory protein
MPIRDYLCQFCGKKIELFDDEKIPNCPQCGKKGLRWQLSAPSVKTSSKSQTDFGQPAGLEIKVDPDSGQVLDAKVVLVGEERTVPTNQPTILSLNQNPDPRRIRALATAMRKPRKKETLH